jgi:hypothetical protein
MSDDNERIGLSGSTPDGQGLRFAAALSGQTGWRRKVAMTVALLALLLIAVAVVVVLVSTVG